MIAKHAHVDDKLMEGEHLAVFALAHPELSPIETPTRLALDWDGDIWIERDPMTGNEIGRGTREAIENGDFQ
ncbi:MAG TPA: hypothetical protein PKE16_11995 [Hyphomicrobium sp.]|nr:hypothetical protein [Hyphomicrobium sp.]